MDIQCNIIDTHVGVVCGQPESISDYESIKCNARVLGVLITANKDTGHIKCRGTREIMNLEANNKAK